MSVSRAGALDEDDGVDAVPFEQRVEIARVERARDGSVLGRHPRLRCVRRVPEVNVRVDDHREASSARLGGECRLRPREAVRELIPRQ